LATALRQYIHFSGHQLSIEESGT